MSSLCSHFREDLSFSDPAPALLQLGLILLGKSLSPNLCVVEGIALVRCGMRELAEGLDSS